MTDTDINEGDLIQAARDEEVHIGRAHWTDNNVVFMSGLPRPVEQLEQEGYLVSILERGKPTEPGYYVDARGRVLQIVAPGEEVGPWARRGPLPEGRGPWRKLRPESDVRAETASAFVDSFRKAVGPPPLGLSYSNEQGHMRFFGPNTERYFFISEEDVNTILRTYGELQ